MSSSTQEPNGRQLYFFVRRPVLAAVISIVIVLLGTFALLGLPVARYPQITPPSVQVTATYPGATAEDVAQAVAAPIEQQLSGLDGLLYYRSSNSSNGVMNLQVFFDIGRDQDIAAVDVQNAIKVAEPQLPEEVRRQGVVIRKAQTDILLVAAVTSQDPRYDATYLANYAKLYVVDELKRLNGVGDATVFGGLDFAMTIRLDPDRMAQLGITVGDVRDAVQEQNATNPAGTLGREPAPKGTQLTLPVTTLGRLKTTEEFSNVIVRARDDGSFVRVGDIGTVELTSQNLDLVGRMNGQPTANVLIYLRPGANQLQVKKAFVARMDELAKAFPSGVTWTIPFDTTPFVNASIKEVVITLLEAMALVTLVVFLFLQSWRATVIPILAVPVSVIGTFLGLSALGYSVNLLTLFALVLAIGIVVDDAIVVIENVERIMDEEKVSAQVAADKAMGQVGGALVAIVLVLCSVFIPVAFLGGITGTMLRQFAVTLVIAVVLSGIVALTLTPALCAMLLKGTPHDTSNRFFRKFNEWFDRTTGGYVSRVGCDAGPPEDVARRVRRDPRARVRALQAGAGRVHPDRGQGLLRHRDPAPRRRVAAADRRGRGAGGRDAAQGGGRPDVRGAGRLQPAGAGQPVQRRHDVRAAQGLGRARQEQHGGRDPGPDQRPALRDEGRARVRVQLPRDPGARHHGRPGGQPPGEARAGRPGLRAAGPGRAGRHEQAAGDAGRGHDLPGQRAAGVRARGPGGRQGARRGAG